MYWNVSAYFVPFSFFVIYIHIYIFGQKKIKIVFHVSCTLKEGTTWVFSVTFFYCALLRVSFFILLSPTTITFPLLFPSDLLLYPYCFFFPSHTHFVPWAVYLFYLQLGKNKDTAAHISEIPGCISPASDCPAVCRALSRIFEQKNKAHQLKSHFLWFVAYAVIYILYIFLIFCNKDFIYCWNVCKDLKEKLLLNLCAHLINYKNQDKLSLEH